MLGFIDIILILLPVICATAHENNEYILDTIENDRAALLGKEFGTHPVS
jgi:hypothetical protein